MSHLDSQRSFATIHRGSRLLERVNRIQAFAKNRREVSGARRGYRDLNRMALRLLAPGGSLITCSCSHHLLPPMFEEILRQSAAGLPFRTILRQRIMAGPDHPVWISLPESEYLKVLVLERVD